MSRFSTGGTLLGELFCRQCATSEKPGLYPKGQAGLCCVAFCAETLLPAADVGAIAISALVAVPLATWHAAERRRAAEIGTARTGGGRGGGARGASPDKADGWPRLSAFLVVSPPWLTSASIHSGLAGGGSVCRSCGACCAVCGCGACSNADFATCCAACDAAGAVACAPACTACATCVAAAPCTCMAACTACCACCGSPLAKLRTSPLAQLGPASGIARNPRLWTRLAAEPSCTNALTHLPSALVVSRLVSADMIASPDGVWEGEGGSGALFGKLHVLLGTALGQALQPAVGLQHHIRESEQQLPVGRCRMRIRSEALEDLVVLLNLDRRACAGLGKCAQD